MMAAVYPDLQFRPDTFDMLLLAQEVGDRKNAELRYLAFRLLE